VIREENVTFKTTPTSTALTLEGITNTREQFRIKTLAH
jgi:hypothetical protein